MFLVLKEPDGMHRVSFAVEGGKLPEHNYSAEDEKKRAKGVVRNWTAPRKATEKAGSGVGNVW